MRLSWDFVWSVSSFSWPVRSIISAACVWVRWSSREMLWRNSASRSVTSPRQALDGGCAGRAARARRWRAGAARAPPRGRRRSLSSLSMRSASRRTCSWISWRRSTWALVDPSRASQSRADTRHVVLDAHGRFVGAGGAGQSSSRCVRAPGRSRRPPAAVSSTRRVVSSIACTRAS